MSRETIWLIVAGLAALVAVPFIYLGLQNDSGGMVTTGFCFFTLGMIISPVMQLFKRNK